LLIVSHLVWGAATEGMVASILDRDKRGRISR
jgi:hypothetical protein